MYPEAGDSASTFDALCCDGETFRERSLENVRGDRGVVLVFDAFAFSAIARNWWRRYRRAGWHEFDGVPVYGVGPDGPYAINAFLRDLDLPFSIFSDANDAIADAYDLLVEREGMGNIETSRRAVFVLDAESTVRFAWVADDWIAPVPTDEVESVVDTL